MAIKTQKSGKVSDNKNTFTKHKHNDMNSNRYLPFKFKGYLIYFYIYHIVRHIVYLLEWWLSQKSVVGFWRMITYIPKEGVGCFWCIFGKSYDFVVRILVFNKIFPFVPISSFTDSYFASRNKSHFGNSLRTA